ncbi:SgcJ/EcaC family oxidoreductase [Streptomyces sp. LN785]|uniref:SgcJ/EcaC family oxidoreductase n=1 Tax=Streptomyces sp. LN785 TaxID=3112983 RepID=UPI00371E6EBF
MDEKPGEDDVARAVRDLYASLLSAWNRRDAQGYAALFAPDAVMVGFDGSHLRGSEVEGHLAPVFADHPTARYVWKIRDVRLLGSDAAMLYAIAGMVPPGRTELKPALNTVQTLVAEHSAGTWRVALFQNTPAAHHNRPELVERHSSELSQVLREASGPA